MTRRLQAGRTLLELLIAMTISIAVLLALSVYFSAASKTARVAQQVSSLNEEAPLAMLSIGQSIKRAGYGEIVGTGYVSRGQTLFDGPHLRGCRSGTFTNPAVGDFSCVAGAAGSPDALMVSFQSDSVVASDQYATRNCAGSPGVATPIADPVHVASGMPVPMVTNVFTVIGSSLSCAGNGAAQEAIGQDITEFRVFYGYDEAAVALSLAGGSGTAPSAATVVNADKIIADNVAFAGTTASAWDHVVSVHVCLVMKTRDASTSVSGTAFAYTGCPTTPTEVVNGTGPARTSSDGAIHKTFNQVYTVRSRATGSPSISIGP